MNARILIVAYYSAFEINNFASVSSYCAEKFANQGRELGEVA